MDLLKNNIGYLGSIFTIVAYWTTKDTSLQAKIVVTVLAISFCIWDWLTVKKIHLIDYAVDETSPDRKINSVLVSSKNDLRYDTMVSLFAAFGKVPTLVAICNIVDNPDKKTLQIDITRRINEEALNKMKDNQTNIKQYYIVPRVRFVDVKGFLKEEGE